MALTTSTADGTTLWLLDKSALARAHDPAVGAVLRPRLAAGHLTTCDVTDLEVLYSARNLAEYERIVRDHEVVYRHEAVHERDGDAPDRSSTSSVGEVRIEPQASPIS